MFLNQCQYCGFAPQEPGRFPVVEQINQDLGRLKHSSTHIWQSNLKLHTLKVGFTISSGVRDSASLQQQHWQQKQLPKHAIFLVVTLRSRLQSNRNLYERQQKTNKTTLIKCLFPLVLRHLRGYARSDISKCFDTKIDSDFSCIVKAEDMTLPLTYLETHNSYRP